MERRQAAASLRMLRTSPLNLTEPEQAAIDLAVVALEAEPSDAWPKIEAPARVGNFILGAGLSARYVVNAAQREYTRHIETMAQTVEQFRQAELDRRDAWDMLNGALVNGMAKDAKRYQTWRTGLMSGGTGFVKAMAAALPPAVGVSREATPYEWDAALDAVGSPPVPFSEASEVKS